MEMAETNGKLEGISNVGFLWPNGDSSAELCHEESRRSSSLDPNHLPNHIEIEKAPLSERQIEKESSLKFLRQATLPFLLAGCGTVGAGLLLDSLQHWELFTYMPEINSIVTPLLGMKGNLEMTLGSRLSTQAHLGGMNTMKQKLKILMTSMALNQTLSIYLSFLASLIAISSTYIDGSNLSGEKAFILCATAIATGSLTSIMLDLLMWTVVVVSGYLKVNPDNVTSPFAGSLGDLASLGFLGIFGTLFMRAQTTAPWLCSTVIVLYFLCVPLYMWVASKDKATFTVLKHALLPVIVAMIISTGAGRIFGMSVQRYNETAIAALQPIMNGIGGNLVSVQASRLATLLHQTVVIGHLSKGTLCTFSSIIRAFFSKDADAKTARLLLLMIVPAQVVFYFVIYFIKGDCNTSLLFIFAYIIAAVIQLLLLLYICQWLVRLMWKLKIDPDSSTIPLLTAFGDLSGSGLMTAAYAIWFAFVKQ